MKAGKLISESIMTSIVTAGLPTFGIRKWEVERNNSRAFPVVYLHPRRMKGL